MKAVIFDSGTLINLSMNGLLDLLERLKATFRGKFLITEAVKYETIDRPLDIQRYELGALRVKDLIERGVLEMPSSLGIDNEAIRKQTEAIMNTANHLIQVKGQWIHLVSEAEISCLALGSQLSIRGIASIIAIDERTTRIMCENPANLERIMSAKLHQRVEVAPENHYEMFGKFKFIRSSEIVFVAYKKGLIPLEGKKVLEALLYATKYKGCSISFEEIDVLKKL